MRWHQVHTPRVLRGTLLALLTVALAACSLTRPRVLPESDSLVYLRAGRFSVYSESVTGSQQSVQGGFVWRDDGQRLRLDLSNPLGTTLARVDASARHAVLTRSDGSRTEAADAEALLAEVLGNRIPVAALRDWLRGRVVGTNARTDAGSASAGSATEVVRDADQRPERFVQDGWQVRLSRYDAQGPRLLRLRREDAGQSIDVRLVVD